MNFTLTLKNEDETALLARDVALMAKAGDVICLSGDLGAGKTAFARHFIRSVSENDELEVPSPTFTLMQVYETPRFTIVHSDLYRLKEVEELAELGFDEQAEGAVILVEWAEKMGDLLTRDALTVSLSLDVKKGVSYRNVTFSGNALWLSRVERLFQARLFLQNAGFEKAERRFMTGDASSRSYERLSHDTYKGVFMNAPVKSDGSPLASGKPYSKIAKLAEDMLPFVALSEGLRANGFSAPLVEVADLKQGFLIIEDLGNEGVLTPSREPILERYMASIEALAHLHGQKLSANLGDYVVPDFDLEAMQAEINLLLDWYLPYLGKKLPASEKQVFFDLWKPLLQEMELKGKESDKTWVLRDFHSPNIIWLPLKKGIERVGIIDFQDAVMGHKAYDVVSLTQDARIQVPLEIESKLLAHYVSLRAKQSTLFDKAAFARGYAIMGAQRATKILGIFARLHLRDGKSGYLQHIPRIKATLFRNLQHPCLKDVARWCEARLN